MNLSVGFTRIDLGISLGKATRESLCSQGLVAPHLGGINTVFGFGVRSENLTNSVWTPTSWATFGVIPAENKYVYRIDFYNTLIGMALLAFINVLQEI